ncbi:PRK06851 family protein [Orenia marismortui]|uniref:PRK06851 family protein n=1 Tax=Orenia marismortui TaxID=46469 RepID=UPI00036B719F|nr:PRK06851 family protein [Orenia marismortui]
MSRGKIKNYYPGGNTSKGFYSFYEYLPYGAERIFVIKGGPGTGKSTFMKKIAYDMVDKGYDIELHWCSSDNESLDGLLIPDLKVALLDGTAPHMVDPKYPGAIDEIINLGRYWDRELIEEGKEKIVGLSKSIWNCFNRAYAYLAEAKLIHDEWEECYLEGMDFQAANKITKDLIEEILDGEKLADELGKDRHLFGSAFTPNGAVDYFDNITEDIETRYIIKGRPGTGKSTLMKKVAESARERGFEVAYFHCSFDPASIDMIVIEELSVALIDGTAPHVVDPVRVGDKVVDMLECVDSEIVEKNTPQIDQVKARYNVVMDNALASIQQAKALHDNLEEFYIEAMDFEAIEERRVDAFNEILDWADIKGYLK